MAATTTKPKKKKKKKGAKSKDKAHDNGALTAKRCDRHELYELSVQEPEAEVELIHQIWKDHRDRRCEHIREDFCGTAVVAMEWVKERRAHTAVGVDLDREVLDWAQKRVGKRLTKEQASRFTLIEGDVLEADTQPVDSVLAMNFSYYLLRKRDELREYFIRARDAIVDDGIFLLDAYGGSEAFLEMEEDREIEGFTYIWDQHRYNPITGEAINYIHFEFPDGSRLDKAFEYTWRLWTLPEVQEILYEAGFKNVWIYWEGTDEDDEGNGEWAQTTEGEACPGWVAYLAASKI